MTRDQLTELLTAALDVAAEPPRRFKSYAYLTNVRIDQIKRLRAALEAAGIEWEPHRIEREEARRRYQQEEAAKRRVLSKHRPQSV